MKDLKSAIFHLERANALLSITQELFVGGGWGVVVVASNLAECCIHCLRALLYYNGATVLDTWDVKTFIAMAMNANIEVPKCITDSTDILQEFSDDALYEVDILKYAKAKDACSKFLSKLNYTIRYEAIIKLRELMGISVAIIPDEDLLYEYWREL